MSRRRGTLRERWDYELEQVRSSTFELIREKLQKRKIELTLLVEKRDVHNLLNSFLVGEVFEEDVLNEFWDYYFKLPASLREVIKAYVDTLVMLLEKTTAAHRTPPATQNAPTNSPAQSRSTSRTTTTTPSTSPPLRRKRWSATTPNLWKTSQKCPDPSLSTSYRSSKNTNRKTS
jgi:hypothetical protein